MYAVAETQLEEMQQFVTLDDVMELVKRLARNTRTLNEMLVLDVASTDDLQRMLVMESTGNYARDGHARYSVVRKLVARILSRERTRMVTEAFGHA